VRSFRGSSHDPTKKKGGRPVFGIGGRGRGKKKGGPGFVSFLVWTTILRKPIWAERGGVGVKDVSPLRGKEERGKGGKTQLTFN